MADYSDQEQAERLLAWWKKYGMSLVGGVLIGLALLYGYRYWTTYQERMRVEASALYEQLEAGRSSQVTEVVGLAGQLMHDYAATPYAGLAALHLARLQYNAGDRAAARVALEWAVANGKGPTMHAARLRLVRLLLEDNALDAAEALLQMRSMEGFDAEYHELRGDLSLARGRPNEAQVAYREALRLTPPDSGYLRLLAMKLDNLGLEEVR